MYSWQSSKQYRPIQVSGTKCWPRNYHPATVTVRCSNISHQDQHRCPNKKRPSWENMQHFVIFVWFVFCFCSRGFSSFHPSFEFQQFWFCVLFSFANIAEQWEPRKKKGVGPLSLLRYAPFVTPRMPSVNGCSFPSPSHKGNTLTLVIVVVVPEITGVVLWFSESQGDEFGLVSFLGWGDSKKGQAWLDRYRLCIAYI